MKCALHEGVQDFKRGGGGGEFVTDFYTGSGTPVDERTRSAMLAGAHAAYALKDIS